MKKNNWTFIKSPILWIAILLFCIDAVLKNTVYTSLPQVGASARFIGSHLLLSHIEIRGNVLSLYIRIFCILVFAFLFARVYRNKVTWLLRLGVTFIFIGLLGNCYDLIHFGLIGGNKAFIPDFNLWCNGCTGIRYIEPLYLNIKTGISFNLSGIMINAGIVFFILGGLVKRNDFIKIIK